MVAGMPVWIIGLKGMMVISINTINDGSMDGGLDKKKLRMFFKTEFF